MDYWNGKLQIGTVSCSSCCFRNWRKLCEEMPCHTEGKFSNVYWYAVHLPENDVLTLIRHFINSGGNLKELAEKKKAELFEFLKAGNTLEEWKNKKYSDAWKGMGRS